MKTPSRLLMVLLLQAMTSFAAEPASVFYAQLIRGTDQEKPPESTWKRIGPKLAQQLFPKFRWKYYWEVNRQTAIVEPTRPTRFRLSAEREVEIGLGTKNDSQIRLYVGGVLTRCSRQPATTPMTIMGGAKENDESWFVVVRRDRPSSYTEAKR
jgi:hypothetical protein